MEEIKLKRTGQLPLAFWGHLLKEEDGQRFKGKGQIRWHEVKLFRTEQSHHYILAITYCSQWEGEADKHDVLVLGPSQEEMIRTLREYNPIPEHIGFPKAPHYVMRQAELESDLRRRFAVLVSGILEDVEGAEERIE